MKKGYIIVVYEKIKNEELMKKYADKGSIAIKKYKPNVLSGGETSLDKTLSEDDLYKLELDSFMKLIEMPKTQERIKHTLATGKLLVN